MSSLYLWIASVPVVEGQFGTGPVDLSVATQVLNGPDEFDLPSGAGQILDRAYRWFVTASNASLDHRQRADLIVDAARALNNLAVWCLTRWGHPDSGEAARSALQEADRILGTISVGGEVRAGVYFNLGQLAAAAGARRDAHHYIGLAQSYGFNVPDGPGADVTAVDGLVVSEANLDDGVRLGDEPAGAMGNGKTQLMFWAALGDENCVRVLMLRGVDVDAVDDDGDTALFYAVSKGHRAVAEILLRHGADPNITGDGGTPIRLAASRGWTDMVRLLASRGASVDARSVVMGTAGVTPIMFAAGGGYVDCLRALLELGADPELVDSDGDDALFYAQSNGKSETARILASARSTDPR